MLAPSTRRTLLAVLLSFALAGAVAVALVAFAASRAGYWLQAGAQAPIRADAIVVLGGNDGDRALRALALYREGHAPRIVLTGLERGNAAPPANLTWRAEFLVANGVPRSALRFEVYSHNSYEEAASVLALMRKQNWKSVIAVSDPPHMRRLAWTWKRVFDGTGLRYALVASAADWWKPGRWWRDERSGAFVISEFVKIGYYFFKR